MADDLRARLIGAELSDDGTQPIAMRTNEEAADLALVVVADWLRNLAEMRDSSWLPVDHSALEDHREVVAQALDALADRITQPSTEEAKR